MPSHATCGCKQAVPTLATPWPHSSGYAVYSLILCVVSWARYTVYTVYRASSHLVVDTSVYDAILYIITGKRLMIKRLNINIKTSMVSILSMLMLIGCSSTGGSFKADHYLQDVNRAYQQGTRPWHPPEGFGYGDQIPNMRGDYDRFCRPPENWRCG